MWSGSRLAWVISLIATAVLVATIASVLPLTHVNNKPVAPARANFNAPTPIGSPIGLPINTSLNTPIYVIGPQTLTQRLVGVGVPQSLIKPIGLGQLSSLPGNSTVIIDYSVIEPSVVVGVVNGEVKLNLTSPVIDLLTSLIAEGDLVMLYGNTSDLPTMEYLLAYTWARKYGILTPSEYLIALPTIPVGSKEALAVAFGGPYYLVIGPVMPRDVVEAIMTYMVLRHLPISRGQVSGAGFSLSMIKANLQSTPLQSTPSQDPDVCYYIYSSYSQAAELSPGVYEPSNDYFIWLLPILNWYGTPDHGVVGYSDGNGTFYYDTCMVINTQVFYDSASNVFDVPVMVYGYVGYSPTQTMINNGGEVLTETGTIDFYTSYENYSESITNSIIAGPDCTGSGCLQPQPTSSTTSYSISVFAGVAGAEPYAGFEFTVTLPSGSSEGISLYYGPSTQVYKTGVGNVTWTFNLNNANTPNDTYYNDFEAITPPLWFMPNFSNLQLQSAYLPVYMSATVLTNYYQFVYGRFLCQESTYEYIWVDGGWWLYAQPTGSSTGLVSSATSYIPSPQLSGTYVSGVTSWSTVEPSFCP
jgi:hypothetical protein